VLQESHGLFEESPRMADDPRLYSGSVHSCTDAALRMALASSAFSNSYRRMSPNGWTEGKFIERIQNPQRTESAVARIETMAGRFSISVPAI
jgi:hypothetical protein